MDLSRVGALIALLLACVFMVSACTQSAKAKETVSPSVGAETPGSEQPEQPSIALDSTDQTQANPVTIVVSGQVKEVMEDRVHVTGIENAMIAGDVIANISQDTVFIDNEKEEYIDISKLTVGMEVQLTLRMAMTRSMPPMANAYMVVVNPSIQKQAQPHYVVVSEVAAGADGTVRLLNQNKDTYIAIPSDLKIESVTADGKNTGDAVKDTDIKEGDVVIAWYGMVALSYPAQAGALRAEVIASK